MIKRDSLETGTFVLLLIAVSLAFGLVIYDFFGAIFWAIILALIFYPLHRWFLNLFKQRQNIASLASLSFCLMLAIIPMIVIISSIVREAVHFFEFIQDPLTGRINLNPYIDQLWAATPEVIKEQFDALFGEENEDTLASIKTAVEQGATRFAAAVGRAAVSWGQNTFSWAIAFAVMLYLLFFLFRDGEVLAHRLVGYIPLSREHKKTLFEKFATVVKATVKGNVVVAIVQGTLGGIAFYFLGVQGALLWAVLMSILSLLPAVGASLVWGPVAIFFLATGRTWEGIGLAVYGVLIIGMIDNVLRPMLVGKDTKMPDYLVLISTLGGISLVGLTGFVVGPLIAALFLAAWGLVEAEESSEERIKEITSKLKIKKKAPDTRKAFKSSAKSDNKTGKTDSAKRAAATPASDTSSSDPNH